MANRWGNNGNSGRFHFPGLQNHCSHEIKRLLLLEKERYDKPRQCITKQRHHFANRGPYSQSCGFSSGHVWIWELDHKEGWVPKNWCFRIVVLEKTLESPLDSKEIKPVNPKGNYPWIFIGRTDAEAEAPILWSSDAKSRLIGKDPDGGKDWRQEEKGTTEDEMVGWHHRLNGYEFEQTPGDGGGQGSLSCFSPWGCKESDMTERVNNNSNTGAMYIYPFSFGFPSHLGHHRAPINRAQSVPFSCLFYT